MPKASTQALSLLIMATIFAVFVFLIFNAFLQDIVGDYIGVGIQQSIDVESLGNAWIFVCTIALVFTSYIAILLSGIERVNGSFSLYLATLTTMLIITLISYISLLNFYPDQFSGVSIIQIFGGFNYYNMIFVVYVLKSQTTYYFIVFGVLLLQTYIYLFITKTFNKNESVISNVRNFIPVRSMV